MPSIRISEYNVFKYVRNVMSRCQLKVAVDIGGDVAVPV